jgi:hypothetical protein
MFVGHLNLSEISDEARDGFVERAQRELRERLRLATLDRHGHRRRRRHQQPAVTLATEHAATATATATTPAAVIARLRVFMMTCPRVLCCELT